MHCETSLPQKHPRLYVNELIPATSLPRSLIFPPFREKRDPGDLSLLHYYPGGILIVQTFWKYAIRPGSDFRPFSEELSTPWCTSVEISKTLYAISGDNNIPDRLAKIVRLQYVLWTEHYKLWTADWRIWLLAVPGPLLRKGRELVFQMHGF